MNNHSAKTLNPEAERGRFDFYVQRDGLDAAKDAMARNKFIYLHTVRGQKAKGCKNHPYRFAYVEAAFSSRHILRNAK